MNLLKTDQEEFYSYFHEYKANFRFRNNYFVFNDKLL